MQDVVISVIRSPCDGRSLLFEETEPWRQLDCESADADLAEIALDAARYWKSYANKTADLLATSIAETACTSAYFIHTSIRSPS